MIGTTLRRHEGGWLVHILVVNRDGGRRADTRALLSRLGREIDGADSSAAALVAVHQRSPALVVLDLETGGLELCREIIERSEATSVIITSAERTTSADRVAGLLVGADDYLGEPFDPDELLARSRRTLSRLDTRWARRPGLASVRTLSPRERQVLGMLANGLTPPEIATALVISLKTVDTHVQHILTKLGLHSRAQAVALALTREANAVLAIRPTLPLNRHLSNPTRPDHR
jgi:DNA-binding NarL/FixJ family response regulator